MVLIDPPQKVDAPPLTNLIALLKDWSIDVGNNAVLDPHEPAARRGRVGAGRGAAVSLAPDHQQLPACSPRSPTRGRSSRSRTPSNGRTATTFIQSGAQQLGGNRPQAADDRGPGAARSRQGRRAGTGLARGRGVGAGRRNAAAARAGEAAESAQAGNPHRGDRRLRLRHQRRPRHRPATATSS